MNGCMEHPHHLFPCIGLLRGTKLHSVEPCDLGLLVIAANLTSVGRLVEAETGTQISGHFRGKTMGLVIDRTWNEGRGGIVSYIHVSY